eukprot:GCRY01004674.1.p1 GENE.GCRY01004674.1~~GCRY01004674.1.p1  ORF type:complete len:431 (+),score=120.01 GCRY01004674.1:102-1394(+)
MEGPPAKKIKTNSGEKDRLLEDFQAWMKESSFNFNKDLEFRNDETSGRGVFATKDIAADAALFVIPKECLLMAATCSSDALKKQLAVSEMDPWSSLIVVLMYEYTNPNSKWRAYLDCLPKSFNTPLFWTDEEVALLKGTSCYDKIGKADIQSTFDTVVVPFMKSNPDLFDNQHTFELYKILGSIVLAYSFSFDEDVICMVPMADLLNHKTGKNNARIFSEEETRDEVEEAELDHFGHPLPPEGLVCHSIKPIAAGEEIYNTYGDLCNADLLRKYGFVDESNPNDLFEIPGTCVSELIESRESNAGLQKRKNSFLEENGLTDEIFVVDAESNYDFPQELRWAVRLALADEETLKRLESRPKRVKKLAPHNDESEALAQILAGRLQEYALSPPECEQQLQQCGPTPTARRFLALTVVNGEFEIAKMLRAHLA